MPLYVDLYFLAASSLLFNNEDIRIPTALQNITYTNIIRDKKKQSLAHLIH